MPTVVLSLVADYGRFNFQTVTNLMRAADFEFPAKPAIKFNTCYLLGFVVSLKNKTHIFELYSHMLYKYLHKLIPDITYTFPTPDKAVMVEVPIDCGLIVVNVAVPRARVIVLSRSPPET